MMRGYEPYWVLPLDGDPIPTIGSGFRQVWVKADVKALHVYLKVPYVEGRVKLTVAQWESLAHVRNTGQSLSDAITALRRYHLTPVPFYEGSPTCPLQPSK